MTAKTLRDWLTEKLSSTIEARQILVGKESAFEEVVERLNPDVYCQICGTRFWNKENKASHKCTESEA